jgi:SAM-dependent methyltransferase
MKVVRPTLVEPFQARIEAATTLAELGAIEGELLALRVLDPACGSGNFLYLAYRAIRKLEKRLQEREDELRRGNVTPMRLAFVSPHQFYGIDINPFAVEIAKATLMLARKLAANELGDERQVLPLDDLDANFTAGDALEVEWPRAAVIIGNPPYLGRNSCWRSVALPIRRGWPITIPMSVDGPTTSRTGFARPTTPSRAVDAAAWSAPPPFAPATPVGPGSTM